MNGADLTGADLSGADLTDANLDDAILTGANIEGATFRYTRLSRTFWPNGRVCAQGSVGRCWVEGQFRMF